MRYLVGLLFCSIALAQPRIWPETTDPSAPGAGFQITFASANHGVCTIDSNGTKTCPVVASGANAAKADTLTTARTINGTSFDGSANITVTAAAGTLTGATLASGVTASSLTSVGTIATGVWQGTVVGSTYGGTGVNNGSSTITIGGNLTISGAFTTTLTVTANTSVTLPTSGTLVNSAVATLSSLTSIGTIGTGVWQGTVVGATYGGTGVNNGSSTVTLGGSLALSGAFTTTLTVSANTSVTLPTSGTLLANSRSISTTSPLGGGGDLSADRTFTCTTCVVASSPGIGLAHFAGSTQTVTSSLVVNADITNSTIDLTAKVTGTLPLAQGGLGIASAPARVVYIPVAGCNNATAGASLDLPTANAPAPTCHGTTTTTGTLDYDNAANEKATFEIVLPTGWTGNEDITLDWYTASTSVSGKWTIETVCKAADGDMVTSPTYNSAQTITTTSSGTANGLTRSTQTGVTTTGCSAGNIEIIRVGRDVTDTSTVTHSLLGIELTIRVTPQT